MTDKQRLALLQEAEKELKLTGQGYIQWSQDHKGGHWPAALKALNELERELKPVVLPPLGPVWVGGRSILNQDLTHTTAGIPLYPAFDDAYVQGRVIIAPEPITICERATSANPGQAFFACGRSKIDYWFGHLDRAHPLGTKFSKGDAIGKVAANSIGGGPHCHVGINVERLLGKGKQLLHHTNYTHGAPTVGAQLKKALA